MTSRLQHCPSHGKFSKLTHTEKDYLSSVSITACTSLSQLHVVPGTPQYQRINDRSE